MLEVLGSLEPYASIIAAIAEVLAFICGAIAIPIAIYSNKKANLANKLSDTANKLANDANGISLDSLRYTQASTLSRYIIKIQLLGIENDSIYADDFEAFLQQGRISVVFKVKNISQNRAIFADFESNDKKEKLRTSGIIIDPDETKNIRYSLSAKKFIDKKPEYTSSDRRTYKDTVYLHWDNGLLSCSCSVKYEFTIVKNNINGQQQFMLKTDNHSADIVSYSYKSFEQ